MIEQYIQYRSAEIVVEQGYQFYTIIDNYTPSSRNTITIKIFEERPEDIDVRDANQILNNIKPKPTQTIDFRNPYIIGFASAVAFVMLGQVFGWFYDDGLFANL